VKRKRSSSLRRTRSGALGPTPTRMAGISPRPIFCRTLHSLWRKTSAVARTVSSWRVSWSMLFLAQILLCAGDVALFGDAAETPPRHHGYSIWRQLPQGRH
jgi:2-polyprenyl-6-methoxyphenol hydroxylase-like FAD-dependent oxidoreductase